MVLILLLLLNFEFPSDPFILGTLHLNHRFSHSFTLLGLFLGAFSSLSEGTSAGMRRLFCLDLDCEGTLEETVEGPKRIETHAVAPDAIEERKSVNLGARRAEDLDHSWSSSDPVVIAS